ncbi:MAG: Zn-ribbon domain-containing OB-fold protein [Candidatus Aenigmarchaeota archaeon]|nr:Zn-ribbon domain-containing OB-fold protein [Candidatus Aenigmarchaeota archaeon]
MSAVLGRPLLFIYSQTKGDVVTKEFAVPFHWRRFKERYMLLGSKCEHCGEYFYPRRTICPKCRRAGKIRDVKFSGKGKVYSYTVIRVPPEGFREFVPYIIAIVELSEGAKVLSQIVDCEVDEVRIGMPVEVCFRRIRSENDSGLILYGFKFRPVKK